MSMNTNTDQNQNYNKYKSTVVDSPVMNGENDLLNLNDYRRALKFNPYNEEARENIKTIKNKL